ncbi:CitMHS family transporter [Enterocloster asparagiformis]|uniref:citrate:proton symporter n=1 Tax=Enterocloster asparagiformis TaxID=333367 RepID=UPI0034BC9225
MLLAITGFVMIGLLMFFLLKGKAIPMTLFVVLPILGAVINGYGLTDIAGFIKDGVSTTWSMAALFVFVVTYFGIMTDVGMFDKLVQKLIRIADGHVLGIFLVVILIATLGHLDGNSPTTYLIAIPALLPLCKKLNIRITAIMAVCCSVITVMNLVPWGGVLNRQSVTLAMDSGLLWRAYLPMQIFGWFCCVGLAVVMSRIEVRRGAGKAAVLAAGETAETAADPEVLALQRPKLLWYNVILTVVVFVLLFKTSLPNYSIFMMGCVLALAVNYPNPKDQEARLAAHAPKVISLVATVLSAGVMVGVLNNTGMIVAMAELIIHILPDFLCAHLHLVFAFFGGFIGLAVSPDPLYYGILPVLIEVCSQYGIPAQSVAIAFGIGADSCFTLAPVIASTYLGLAVSGLSLKEHMRFSFFPLWIVGLLMIAFGCVMGYIVI